MSSIWGRRARSHWRSRRRIVLQCHLSTAATESLDTALSEDEAPVEGEVRVISHMFVEPGARC
eukprot:5582640-Pyramimonas_sp.AAC.1